MDYDHIIRTVKVQDSGRNRLEIKETYVLRGHGLPEGYNYRIHVGEGMGEGFRMGSYLLRPTAPGASLPRSSASRSRSTT